MNNNINKQTTISSLIWKFLERCGSQGIQFIIQIILARILLPSAYGVTTLITVFIAVANVFVQSGFSSALIQKKEIDDIDSSSVFYLSVVFATILYGILFLLSSFIANFYGIDILKPIMRVLSITLFFGAINGVQNAIVSRTMQFKRFFFSSIGAAIASGIIGIMVACLGGGVWALVIQQLSSGLFTTAILWFTVKWRPHLCFSLKRIKILYSYSWKLLCSSLIDTIYNNLYNLVIGKHYSSETLAFYNRGYTFSSAIVTNINGSIQSVIFPVMSAEQDNIKRVKVITRRSISTSAFIVFPILAGLAGVATPMVHILLTDKWLPCVPYLRLCCLVFAFWPIHTANLQAINAMGRSDIFLKLEIIKKIVGVTILIVTLRISVLAMVVGSCIEGLIATFINSYPNKKLMNYSYLEQIKDLLPPALLSIAMFTIISTLTSLRLSSWVTLLIQIVIGIIIYIGGAKVFHFECLDYVLNTVRGFMNKKWKSSPEIF